MGTDMITWMKKLIKLGDNWDIKDIEFQENPEQIYVKTDYVGPEACPICGQTCSRYDFRTRKWRDFYYGDAPCIVEAKVPRFNCPVHGVHEVDVKWAGEVSRLTKRFERRCAEYARYMPIHLVGKLLGVHDNTLWKIVRHYIDIAMEFLDLSDLTAFCIDETSSKKGHEYITSVTNPVTGGVVFVTEGHDHTALEEFHAWLIAHNGDPSKIHAVCCDMSPAYTKGIRDFFPGAVICYDPFHVIQAANNTLEKVRRTSGLKGRLGKGLRFDFLRNKESMTEEKKQRLNEVFDEYFYLGKAYTIKELLRDFYSLNSYEAAVQFLLGIIDRCLDSKNPHIFDLAFTLDNHFWGILEWHRTRMSNGMAEGNNSVIQAMKRTSRGFRAPSNMMTLVYLRSLKKNGLEI